MPISQPRMLTLIQAALDYKQALETIEQVVASNTARVRAGAITPAEYIDIISGMVSSYLLLKYPTKSPAAILIEQAHFRRNGKQNTAAAARQRRRRQIRNTSASSLYPSQEPHNSQPSAPTHPAEPIYEAEPISDPVLILRGALINSTSHDPALTDALDLGPSQDQDQDQDL